MYGLSNPVYYEWGANSVNGSYWYNSATTPGTGYTPTEYQKMRYYWIYLMGAASHGQFMESNLSWTTNATPVPFDSKYQYEVNDWWVNSNRRAWVVFRDREFPTGDFGPGYGQSGWIGDFTKFMTVRNPQDAPQACNAYVRATA